jgi:hypothetical protein
VSNISRYPQFASTADPSVYLIEIANKQSGSMVVNQHVKEIGTWNMDSDATKVVSFSLNVNIKRISSIHLVIYKDDLSEVFGIGGIDSCKYDATNGVTVTRTASGIFDGTDFNSTSINRGIITICYTT